MRLPSLRHDLLNGGPIALAIGLNSFLQARKCDCVRSNHRAFPARQQRTAGASSRPLGSQVWDKSTVRSQVPVATFAPIQGVKSNRVIVASPRFVYAFISRKFPNLTSENLSLSQNPRRRSPVRLASQRRSDDESSVAKRDYGHSAPGRLNSHCPDLK